MPRDELIRRLMDTFLREVDEHVRALNRDLLALEKEPAGETAPELLKTLFRTAHSLKGASRSVSVSLIESACHRLEEILAAARDRLVPLDAMFFQLLFATADAIDEAGRRLRDQQDLSGASLVALLPRLDAVARGSGTPSTQPAPALHADIPAARPDSSERHGVVRVPAEKLDALLARSGELLVARRRSGTRAEELDALQRFVERWRAEWRRTEKPLARWLRGRGNGKGGATAAPGVAEQPSDLSPRAARTLTRTGQNLGRLGRALDRLAVGLAGDQHNLEQVAAPLEEQVRQVRMLPFAEACEGLERVVRDLAKTGDKDVRLVVEGGQVELDRSSLEQLKDPLLHLVRNAVDHGIETPAERRALGKPALARVTVAAALRGSQVQVTVTDDGRGLDLDAIREHVRKKRLAQPEDDRELARLIFLPGFSTSRIITELSGRGIGLDVVKTRVESLQGFVDFSFEPGRGTQFVLTVPLTLTTIQAVLVAAGGQVFALAETNVRRLVRIGREDVRSVEGREVVSFAGAPIPIVPLAEAVGLAAREVARRAGKAPVVVLAAGERLMAFAVDEVLAEQEVVVKALGPRLRRVRNVAGATVLPTGRIALILNAGDLIGTALRRAPGQALSTALAEGTPEVKKRLLVVDDSVTTRSLERSILEAAGYDVMVAVDGADAWQLLQEKGADLVVADVDMPRMDGIALTEAIRGSKRFRDLAVVLVTALESERDKARGIEAGADAYLLKSAFDQKSLLETIVQLL